MNAAAHVNGHFIGDGGSMERPLSRNANRPLLFNVPTGMLEPGRNVVRIRLAIEPTFSALLDPVLIGPHAALQPRFETQSTFTVLVPQVVAILCFAVALLILGVFVRADDEGANPWFAAALILWAVVLTQGFLRDPPVPARLWEFIGIASLAAVVYCLARAFHLRIFGRRLIPRERILLAVLGLPGIVTALAPTRYAFGWWIGWQVITGTVAGYILILVYHATKRGLITHPKTLATATITGALLASHDLASVFWGGPISGFWLASYAASVALLFTGWTILATMASSLTEAETLNRELEGRVQQKHDLLEANYQRLRVLERESAIAAERNGIEIDWEVQDVPPIRGFGPEQALQVLRVVQKAIANVLKHAGARRVGIRTGTTEEAGRAEAFVEVEGDGGGMSEDIRLSRGLSNHPTTSGDARRRVGDRLGREWNPGTTPTSPGLTRDQRTGLNRRAGASYLPGGSRAS